MQQVDIIGPPEVVEVASEDQAEETISEISSSTSSSSSSSQSSSGSNCTSYEDFCGQQASELNLRQLRLSALEDVLVCGQQRHSTESARRLFNMLATPKANQKCPPPTLKANGSLGSRSGEDEEDDDDEEELRFQNNDNNNNNNYDDDIYAARTDTRDDDYGSIRIATAGRTSSNSDGHSYRGRTLVCSVSPVSQLGGGGGGSGSASVNGDEIVAEDHHNLPAHSVDGDEIRHCREAFRQNRRLIEAQAEALLNTSDQQQQQQRTLSRCSSVMTVDRSRWLDSLSRRQRLPDCAHCHRPLYPTDRMELDFTRSRLNIHRNCFKCQVCSTMLRLETYASIDAKLYCPAHTKCAVNNC